MELCKSRKYDRSNEFNQNYVFGGARFIELAPSILLERTMPAQVQFRSRLFSLNCYIRAPPLAPLQISFDITRHPLHYPPGHHKSIQDDPLLYKKPSR